MKKKTVYALRLRDTDEGDWGEPTYYKTQKERDNDAAECRALGGFRTWRYEEKVSPERAKELIDREGE